MREEWKEGEREKKNKQSKSGKWTCKCTAINAEWEWSVQRWEVAPWSGNAEASGCLIYLLCIHSYVPFLIHFQSSSRHPCDRTDLIPPCSSVANAFFFFFFLIKKFLPSLHWEVIGLTYFLLPFSSFSSPLSFIPISVSILVFHAVIRCGESQGCLSATKKDMRLF